MSDLNSVKSILKSIIISAPTNITVQQLNNDYKNLEGTQIPFSRFGYTTLNEFLNSLPDILNVIGYGWNALVLVRNIGESSHIQHLVDCAKSNKKRVTGDDCRFNRSNNRNQQYNQQRSQSKYNHYSMESTTSQQQMKGSGGGARFTAVPTDDDYDEWNPMPQQVKQTRDDKYCSSVLSFKMPIKNNITSYPLVVLSVTSPNEFYFQICKTDEFDQLMIQMQNFYTKLSRTDHQIVEPTKGQICCCEVDGHWCRGRIVRVYPDEGVTEIDLIDFAGTEMVDEYKIKYLSSVFGKLPEQRGTGMLYAVKPLDGGRNWTKNTVNAFKNMVIGKILYARNCKYNEKDAIVKMVMIDTNGDSDWEINKQLIKEKMAQLSE